MAGCDASAGCNRCEKSTRRSSACGFFWLCNLCQLQGAGLALAMADLGSHTSLLATNLPPTLTCSLCTHARKSLPRGFLVNPNCNPILASIQHRMRFLNRRCGCIPLLTASRTPQRHSRFRIGALPRDSVPPRAISSIFPTDGRLMLGADNIVVALSPVLIGHSTVASQTNTNDWNRG